MMTGAIEAMVVDVQCIMQALAPLAERYHTQLITTSPKAKITGAMHIEFDEHRALEIAKQIVRMAIDNYPNRGKTTIPAITGEHGRRASLTSTSTICRAAVYRASFRPLNDAIIAGPHSRRGRRRRLQQRPCLP